MVDISENTYWIAIAHLPRWSTDRINRLIIQVLHENKMSWDDFFSCDRKEWKGIFDFTDKELDDLERERNDLPKLAFIAEQLNNEGFEIIPINSKYYSQVLKENLKVKSSPPILYVKGRKGLLEEDAVAIVGSRKAGKVALDFTHHVADKSVSESKVVVSGFAKGVDKQALDSTIQANGKSIIVLPQGILTFGSAFKKYYEHIVNGNVLVLSTFFPKAGWDVGLAMARNAYIYGLAKEIYVAESDEKGGTWEGAMNGLKRQRKIYVRLPGSNEKNANLRIIELGGIPVDLHGNIINPVEPSLETRTQPSDPGVQERPGTYKAPVAEIEESIHDLLKKGSFTSKEIIQALGLDWSAKKLASFLKKNPNVKCSGKPMKYSLKEAITPRLFR